ncbi:hypothetical protein QBC35DRAFT_496403 [Podospora australis]|uniref:TNT domain-containing protein n=1 Tax=Podospora australis TaxID=1536484 RepID=A0AAN6WW79_9PEZI|nr:hypothetical protein QBC35DRAFT_496403 [Podospora australis]
MKPTLLPFALFLFWRTTAALPVPSVADSQHGDDPYTTPLYCQNTAYNISQLDSYLCGDQRLGPTSLPKRLPLDPLTDFYDRLGGLCPGEFLDAWWNSTIKWWNYPDFQGFVLSDAGVPIQGNVTLVKGTLIDRFGGPGGDFVSPAGSPYMQRALPPMNLNTPDEDPQAHFNYHLYRVLKPLTVTSGPIAPWFGQPGNGVQYHLPQSVGALVVAEILEREDPDNLIIGF